MAKSDKRPVIKLKSTAGTGFTYSTRTQYKKYHQSLFQKSYSKLDF